MDLKEIGWEVWIGCICIRIETSSGPFEHDNEVTDSVKCCKFLG